MAKKNKEKSPDGSKKELDWFKRREASKYAHVQLGGLGISFDDTFIDIDERLRDLEYKVNKTARKEITNRAQQMLLLYHLGVIDKLNETNISQKAKAKFLSALINASAENIEKDLARLYNPDEKNLKTSTNYKFISLLFKDCGLTEYYNETDKISDEIIKKEDKI